MRLSPGKYASVLFLAFTCASNAVQSAPGQPHILLVMTDDKE